MKKLFIFTIAMSISVQVLLLVLVGCGNANQTGGDELTFLAKILQINGDTVTVAPLEWEDILRSSDQITFSIRELDNIGASVGDTVNVLYVGSIKEIYPAEVDARSWSIFEKANTQVGAEYQDAKRVDLGCCMTKIAVRDEALLGANSVSHNNDNFIMTLNSNRRAYSTTDIIRIWGTLEYVGESDTIEIWSGCPFMQFSIAGGDELDFGSVLIGGQFDVFVTSVLEKGRVYHFDYQKSGGWSGDDPNSAYWENFFSEKDLMLPVGVYTVTMVGIFSYNDRVFGCESGLSA
jgi:hypothetical protein